MGFQRKKKGIKPMFTEGSLTVGTEIEGVI
jgi:hypothetical protein